MYKLVSYSIENLAQILAQHSGEDGPDAVAAKLRLVRNKLHHTYFEEYFKKLDAKTIVVEADYVDRDYLEDFAAYYVRCFKPYERLCARLHFFATEFSEAEFEALLNGVRQNLTHDRLDANYLGFVVVKPLPNTIVGRTLLKTYDEEGGRRNYPIKQDFDAHLFGITLRVASLPFQEQDEAAAKCATSALWSVFHGTGKMFHHSIPSPVEITKAALENTGSDKRSLPSPGLTAGQMAQAIRDVGLDPFLVDTEEEHVLRSTAYAYARGKIPTVLGFYLVDSATTGICRVNSLMGKHGVAVVGYSLGGPTRPFGPSGFVLRASRIDKLYVHDDQVGPFARMVFDGSTVKLDLGGTKETRWSLGTSWRGSSGAVGSARAVTDILLAPLYPKIRIPFSAVHDTVVEFDGLTEALRSAGRLPVTQRLEWDIYLTTVSELKNEIFTSQATTVEPRSTILSSDMPRFIWRAGAFDGDERVLDLLFDATDIEQGSFFFRAIEYSATVSTVLRAISRSAGIAGFQNNSEQQILAWFASQ